MSTINNQSSLLPPWLKCPTLSRGSSGWQEGDAQSYWYAFYNWFHELTEQEQALYQIQFPEPKQWHGFYALYQEQNETVSSSEAFSYKGISFWEEHGIAKYTAASILETKPNQNDFILFWGHTPDKNNEITKSCLSQWWLSDFFDGNTTYCCMEQYMMGQKARVFGDEKTRDKILNSQDQKQIKELGRQVKKFDHNIWDKVKYSIVLNGNYFKFTQDEKLMSFLLATGDKILVEASPYDKIWGIGLSEQEKEATQIEKWQGQNLLGFALMEVRDEIRRVYQNK